MDSLSYEKMPVELETPQGPMTGDETLEYLFDIARESRKIGIGTALWHDAAKNERDACIRGWSVNRGLEDYARRLCPELKKCILKKAIARKDSSFVLDIGCGKGMFLDDVCTLNPRIQAFGISKHSYYSNCPERIIIGDVGTYAPSYFTSVLTLLPQNTFDLIVSVGCVAHMNDKQRELHYIDFFKNIYYLLAPGGYALIDVNGKDNCCIPQKKLEQLSQQAGLLPNSYREAKTRVIAFQRSLHPE